jgi:hypothetical protein
VLQERLGLGHDEFVSLVRLLVSDMDVSFRRLLGDRSTG